jgi:acyl-coenzyme A thioesterase PaaI-like protein
MGIPDQTNLAEYYQTQTEAITPAFPNWQKSFISGPDSPLFEIEHRIHQRQPQLLISRVTFKSKAEGPPGHVHGGASAALIDEVMGIVVWHNQFLCVTQNLNLRYVKALPLSVDGYLVTEIVKVNERTIEVDCTIFDHKKTPYVSAQGVFHRLSESQLKLFTRTDPGKPGC